MLDKGLIASQYLEKTGKDEKCAIRRYYDLLRNKAHYLSDETLEQIKDIAKYSELPFVEYRHNYLEISKIKNLRIAQDNVPGLVNWIHREMSKLLEGKDYSLLDKIKEYENPVFINYGNQDKYSKKYGLFQSKNYSLANLKASGLGFKTYDFDEIKTALDNLGKSAEADEGFIDKLNAVNENLAVIGKDKQVSKVLNIKYDNNKTYYVNKKFKTRVEELHKDLMNSK